MHINQLVRSFYYQLRQLQVIYRSLSCSAASALVHAFVTSRLDHCSSILVCLSVALIAHLDRVLHCVASLIGCVPKCASVSACMRDMLHWLPIAQRISYRLAVLVWRCLLGSASAYLCKLYSSVSQTGVRGPLGFREALAGAPREIIGFL